MRTIQRDIVGVFLFSNDGYMLLGKSRKGGVYQDYWVVPGGGIEPAETKLQAAIRETQEEVGIDISAFPTELVDAVLTDKTEKILRDTNEEVMVEMTFYSFVVRADKPSTAIAIRCEDDLAEASWHPVAKLAEISLPPSTAALLRTINYLPSE
jgi:8-oxo-dGTP pyrophosphatase MutT (NUDIX family)